MTWYDTVPWGNQPVIWLQIGIWPSFLPGKGQLIVIAGIDKYFLMDLPFLPKCLTQQYYPRAQRMEIYCQGILYNFSLIESIKGPILQWGKGDQKSVAMRYSFYYKLHYLKSAGLIKCWILSCVSSRHKKTTRLWMTRYSCGLGVCPSRVNGYCVMPCL